MMTTVPFESEHLDRLSLHESQAQYEQYFKDPEYGIGLKNAGPSVTIQSEGVILGCGGIVIMEAHRGHMWSLLSRYMGMNFPLFHKHVLKFVGSLSGVQRVEMAVSTGFKPAARWAEMLGFEREARMRSYFPGGEDAYLYAKVNESWQV